MQSKIFHEDYSFCLFSVFYLISFLNVNFRTLIWIDFFIFIVPFIPDRYLCCKYLLFLTGLLILHSNFLPVILIMSCFFLIIVMILFTNFFKHRQQF
jgi:hypothetical protein